MTAEQFYYFACGAVLVLTLVIFWVAVIMPTKNQWEKRFLSLGLQFLFCV